MVEAIHRLRKSEDRSGSKPVECRLAVKSCLETGGGLGVGERGMGLQHKSPNDTEVMTHAPRSWATDWRLAWER
jgi:hypothetical protein